MKIPVPTELLRPVDVEFAHLLERLAEKKDPVLNRLFASTSFALANQHTCLDITGLSATDREALMTSGVVGDGSCPTPLVVCGDRLYLYRYYRYEAEIARQLLARNRSLAVPEGLESSLAKYFTADADGSNWQAVAALSALTRSLTVITGGPGTGKTSTVLRILAMFVELLDGPPVIKLAAPTGKAAMRLATSIEAQRGDLEAHIAGHVPGEVRTLHRLLGMRADGRTFRYSADAQLNADILVIDETSMIDLPMMHRLLVATPLETRIILLGDPNQLPAVDVGNILRDVQVASGEYSPAFCDQIERLLRTKMIPKPENAMSDVVTELVTSHRFATTKGIGKLAAAVQNADEDYFPTPDGEVQVRELGTDKVLTPANIMNGEFGAYIDLIKNDAPATDLLKALEQFRVLCPQHEGQWGVEQLNEVLESRLESLLLKRSDQAFYHGRPVMVTRNDYNLNLYNGDVGVTIADAGQFSVVFPAGDGGTTQFLATRLPAHTTCFAMTIHKSQGSEFDRVMLVLPEPATLAGEQLLSRELLYTAVTRAREQISLLVHKATFSLAIGRATSRGSGLAALLNPANTSTTPTVTVKNNEQLSLF